MSEPSTILLPEADEERTLIDQKRLADPDPPFEGSGLAKSAADARPPARAPAETPQVRWRRLRARLCGAERRLMELGLVLALVLSSGSLAYRQSRASDELRRAIDDMRLRRLATPTTDVVGSSERPPVPAPPEPTPSTSSGDLSSIGRDELEALGARLIAANHFERALPEYQRLVRLVPTEPAFQDVIVVLMGKLGCGGPIDPTRVGCR